MIIGIMNGSRSFEDLMAYVRAEGVAGRTACLTVLEIAHAFHGLPPDHVDYERATWTGVERIEDETGTLSDPLSDGKYLFRRASMRGGEGEDQDD